MANGLPDLNDLINYEKYKEDLPDYSLFRQSIADVDPVSAVTAKAVPSLQDTFAPSSAASAPAIEAGAGNQFLDLYNSLVKQNPSPVVAPDTSNQQLAEIAATSIAPALIGLILKGKRGAGIGAAIGGQAGAALSQRQRAEAIQQAQLDNQTQRETRQLAQNIMSSEMQDKRLATQERIAEARRDADRQDDKTYFDNQLKLLDAREGSKQAAEQRKLDLENKDRLSKYEKVNQDLSTFGVKVNPVVGSNGIVSDLDKKEAAQVKQKVEAYEPLMQTFNKAIETYKSTDSSQKAAVFNDLILKLKADAINKGGAAFSALEYLLNSAGLPRDTILNLESANIWSDALAAIQQKLNGVDGVQSLIDVAGTYKDRASTEIGVLGGELIDSIPTKDGESIPTAWGKINQYKTSYQRMNEAGGVGTSLDKYKSTGSSGTQTAASPFQFNMSRAQEAFKRRQGVQ